MGWIRDTFQEYHIGRAKTVASRTALKSQANATSIDSVEKKLDNLVLITQAIWELLEESGVSEHQLEKKMQEIDARDGVMEGKLEIALEACPECVKKNRRHGAQTVSGAAPSCRPVISCPKPSSYE